MTKEEQIRFITELTHSVRDELITEVEMDNVPDTWDGFELRQWLADKFKNSTRPMGHQRRAEFNNYILIHNL